MKEIYTDLEKKDTDPILNIKKDTTWAKTFDFLKNELTLGIDFEIVGADITIKNSPTREDDEIIYKIKVISDKAKKMFIAE